MRVFLLICSLVFFCSCSKDIFERSEGGKELYSRPFDGYLKVMKGEGFCNIQLRNDNDEDLLIIERKDNSIELYFKTGIENYTKSKELMVWIDGKPQKLGYFEVTKAKKGDLRFKTNIGRSIMLKFEKSDVLSVFLIEGKWKDVSRRAFRLEEFGKALDVYRKRCG